MWYYRYTFNNNVCYTLCYHKPKECDWVDTRIIKKIKLKPHEWRLVSKFKKENKPVDFEIKEIIAKNHGLFL